MNATVERFIIICIVVLLITLAMTCHAENIAECTRDTDLLTVAEVQEYLGCTFKNGRQADITACEQEVIRKSGIPPECAKLYDNL